MRSDRVIGVLPAAAGDWALAHCFMLHGPFNKQGVEWLDLAEDLFARFGSAPERATAGSGGERSFGAYKRVRKRLQRFLEPADGGPSIELDGGLLQSTGGFFQYSIKLVVNGCRSALLAVDQSLAKGHEVLLDRAAASLFAALGPAYGFAVDFPAAFGPHGYLVGLI